MNTFWIIVVSLAAGAAIGIVWLAGSILGGGVVRGIKGIWTLVLMKLFWKP